MPRASEFFGSTYLTAAELKPIGKHHLVTIESVKVETMPRSGERKLVVYLAGLRDELRPYIPNQTAGRQLLKSFGDDTALWRDKDIKICCEPTLYQGRDTLGIRIVMPTGEDELDDEIPL
jgi:hypothetical protein